MNILLISDNFLPELGGVERHTFTLLKFLHEQGIDVQVITSSPGNSDTAKIDEQYDIKRSLKIKKRDSALQWPRNYIMNSDEVSKTINNQGSDFDLVHHHGSFILSLNNVNPDIKLATTRHGILAACIGNWGIDSWCGEKPNPINCALCVAKLRPSYNILIPGMILYSSYFYNKMGKSLRRVNRNITVSKFVYRILYTSYRLDNMKVIYNFIDAENDIYHYINEEEGKKLVNRKENEIILLYSGRLDTQKGVKILMKSFNEINKSEKNIKLYITGDGELKKEIMDYSSRNENVTYKGYVSRNEQLNIMNQSDVLIAPSIYPDACPTSIIEAISLGKPVITTTSGGIPEIIDDGLTGYLIKPGDVSELTDKIRQITNENLTKYKKVCINKSKQFDIKNVGPQIIREYEEILKNR